MLVDPKFSIHQPDALDKIGAIHTAYGNVLILYREGNARWLTVNREPNTQKVRLGNDFRFADARGY